MGCGASSSAVAPIANEEVEVAREQYFTVGKMLKLVSPDPQTGAADVRLLSAKFLVDTAAAKRILPMRQELEVASKLAYLPLPAVKRCLDEVATCAKTWPTKATYPGIIVVSYCWHSGKHPDPDGELLKMLARFLSWYMKQREAVRPNAPNDCGVFLDFFSLYQGDRTPAQEAAFVRALHSMDVWYAHAGTCVLRISKAPSTWQVAPGRQYHERGWCTFELVCSMIAKHWACTLDYCTFDGKSLESMVSKRMAPMHPDEFRKLIVKKNFAVAKDNLMVHKLYIKVCKGVLGAATEELDFSKKKWAADDFSSLANSLAMAQRLKGKLRLNRTAMDPAGVRAFCDGLSPKALPMLSELDLSDNQLGDEGATILAAALQAGKLPSLAVLHITQGTKIGTKGKAALANCMKARRPGGAAAALVGAASSAAKQAHGTASSAAKQAHGAASSAAKQAQKQAKAVSAEASKTLRLL